MVLEESSDDRREQMFREWEVSNDFPTTHPVEEAEWVETDNAFCLLSTVYVEIQPDPLMALMGVRMSGYAVAPVILISKS